MMSFFISFFEHGPTDWDSQYFKLGGGVLCHHSPRRISLTFGQHPLYSVSDPYICATALYRPCYHFHPRHSLHPPFASSRHLLTPKLSHPSHIIGSFVTGTSIMSAHQEARPDSLVPPLLRQAMEYGGN